MAQRFLAALAAMADQISAGTSAQSSSGAPSEGDVARDWANLQLARAIDSYFDQ